jgi:glycine oxidase
MRADILVVGQGLAGTLLAWELERAGIEFAIADPGHAAASSVAAGIVNPITGQRLVKSWRVDAWLPFARESYCALETALGVPLWREMRVRRFFADERERRVATEKQARGELAPYVREVVDGDGCWIEGAAQVDLGALRSAARARWVAQRRWREDAVDIARAADHYELIVDCRGLTGAREGIFDFVPWEFSKGELLVVATDGLAADVILNRGHWLMPLSATTAWVGATHEPGVVDRTPTDPARRELEASARALLGGRTFRVTGHLAGVRVNLPDKRPIAGRHPRQPRVGVLNGLGAKGALWAPALARQWVNHLTEGVPFDLEIDAGRTFARNSSQASAR